MLSVQDILHTTREFVIFLSGIGIFFIYLESNHGNNSNRMVIIKNFVIFFVRIHEQDSNPRHTEKDLSKENIFGDEPYAIKI